MGRYVTRAGVVIEMGDEAARAVGYQPAGEQKAPVKRGRRSKQAEEPSGDE